MQQIQQNPVKEWNNIPLKQQKKLLKTLEKNHFEWLLFIDEQYRLANDLERSNFFEALNYYFQ